MNKDKPELSSESIFEKAIKKYSFKAKNETEKEEIIQDYYKFVMYRNPLERLFSGFMSKIQAYPLFGLESSKPAERNWLRLAVYKATHPVEFEAWKKDGGKIPILISWSDFIDYWILTGGIRRDEHFRTIFELCSPCKVRYSYYGNFNSFDRDVGVFSERIHGNMSPLLGAKHRDVGPSSELAPIYYKHLSLQQKKSIIDILATELHFYYSLFPDEANSHKEILGVDIDLPEMG